MIKRSGNIDTNEQIQSWKAEEKIAHIHGWDFSHIAGRFEEEELPWDYRQIILKYLIRFLLVAQK